VITGAVLFGFDAEFECGVFGVVVVDPSAIPADGCLVLLEREAEFLAGRFDGGEVAEFSLNADDV
jgi:hypothetical protein